MNEVCPMNKLTVPARIFGIHFFTIGVAFLSKNAFAWIHGSEEKWIMRVIISTE